MSKKKIITTVVIINFAIFVIANLLFTIKYEQVDDFIIYNMYSGLDGSFNIHGIYIHPIICFILGILFKIIPIINWHSIFLLSAQFICFTLIGYRLIHKHQNGISIILYSFFVSIFYACMLMLIQYTSVAALLIITSLFLLIDKIELKEKISIRYKIIIFLLFALGIMIRTQALIICLPFMGIYLLIKIIRKIKEKVTKNELIRLIKYYSIYCIILAVVYISNIVIYNLNPLYKNYMEYNDIRSNLHDINYVDYYENKEIFDEVGWSKNDYYLFYTFNFGDENKYSKDNLKKILDYKIAKDGNFSFNWNLEEINDSLVNELLNINTYIAILFFGVFILSLFINKKNNWINILIFITTIALNIFFIILGRSMLRVIIPEYIMGTLLIMYNIKFTKNENNIFNYKNSIILFITMLILVFATGQKYNYGYNIKDYESTRNIIEYTSKNKENVYLYTVPSLQFRYLAYNVYQMPPKEAFSNLRVLGGWDMYTGNYYDFKNRYNLDGTFLDLLKDNVYLIDGEVVWSGTLYDDYKQNIIEFIKENYGIDTKCELIKEFDNLSIYKLKEID